MDVFQPRKTGTEKELLYSRVVVPRQSVELILECVYVDYYGGDTRSFEHAVDILLKQYNIPKKYTWKFAGMLLCWWCQCQHGQV